MFALQTSICNTSHVEQISVFDHVVRGLLVAVPVAVPVAVAVLVAVLVASSRLEPLRLFMWINLPPRTITATLILLLLLVLLLPLLLLLYTTTRFSAQG